MSGDRVRRRGGDAWGKLHRSEVRTLGHGIALSVYTALATWADDDTGECFPAQAMLAELLGVSASQVDRGIAECKHAGLLEVQPRLHKGRKFGNTYILGSTAGDASADSTEAPPVTLPQSTAGDASYQLHRPEEQTNRRPSPDDLHEEVFDAFWTVYPRKTAKRTARRAWDARMREGVEPQLLVDSARAYAAGLNGTDQRYIKHAATFLGPDRHWLDVTPAPPEKVFQPGFVDL